MQPAPPDDRPADPAPTGRGTTKSRSAATPASPHQRLLGLATLAGIAAWLLIVGLNPPADFPAWYRCPFHTVTGLHCPGCGSTRATHALLNADPLASLRNNPLLILLGVPALVALARSSVRRLTGTAPASATPNGGLPGWTGHAVLATVLVFWIVRNIPHPALETLRPIEVERKVDGESGRAGNCPNAAVSPADNFTQRDGNKADPASTIEP